MSSVTDNLLRVQFLLIPKSNFFIDTLTSPQVIWKFAGASLLQSPRFGGQIKKTIPGTESIIDSANKITSVSDRIQFVYDTINKRVPEKVEQALDADDIIDAWNNKDGNSTEINLMLLNLLRKAKVKCYPVLISTRNHGEINTDFPGLGQFDGMDVLAIDSDKVYVMDASLKWQSYQTPPFNVLNRLGFVLIDDNMKTNNSMQWVKIDDSRPLIKQDVSIHAVFKSNENIEGVIKADYYNYAKALVLDSTNEDENENRFVNLKTEGVKIISKKLEQSLHDAEPLKQQIEFSYQPQKTGDFYFFNPQFLFSKKENPFTSNTRSTDIDFGCNQQLTLSLQLDIPSSYEIEFLPKTMTVRAPDSSFFFQRICSKDSSSLFLVQTFEIRQPIFDKEAYPAIQEFFKRIYTLMAEEIIIKKRK